MKKRKSSWNNELPEYSYLPPELLEEVLARVPVKPLLKFRCVSKTWCSLIDSSDFISMHRRLYNNSVNTPLLLAIETRIRKGSSITVRRSDTFRNFSNIGKLPKSCSILQTCNGLTLIESRDSSNNYARVLMLWNPCIRKCLILPNPPPHDDPCRFSRDRYVLGFAPCSNDYKVLAFRRGSRVRSLRIAVYSLNDHCWRVITNRTCVEDFVESWPGSTKYYAFSGSSVYWLVRYEYTGETAVLCFDFDVEEFKSVRLPDAVKESSFWFIFALSGSIAVFTMSSENIRIWIMEKDGGEDPWRLWNLVESCSKLLESVSKGLPCSDTMYVQNSNTIFMVRTNFERTKRRTQDTLMSYNITTQQVQHLGKSIRGYISFDPYVESLVLHKGLEGQNLTSFP